MVLNKRVGVLEVNREDYLDRRSLGLPEKIIGARERVDETVIGRPLTGGPAGLEILGHPGRQIARQPLA